MSFFAGILIFVLIVNCALLILLVLMQLPKKDAGAGLAFGGGAADALFGAGSGNTLTKITKWATGIFFAMALILGAVQAGASRGSSSASFEQAVDQNQSKMPVGAQPGTLPPVAPTTTSNSPTLPTIPVGTPPATPQPK